MSNQKKIHFHIAYYIDTNNNILSGKTYSSCSISSAVEEYTTDSNTPSIDKIKYISCEENMRKEELQDIKIQIYEQ
jgi:hypothetical protein